MKEATGQILAGIALILTYFIGILIRKLLMRLAESSKFTRVTQSFIQSIAKTTPILLYTVLVYIGKDHVAIQSELISDWIIIANDVLINLTIGIWAFHLIEVPTVMFEKSIEKDGKKTARMLSPLLKITLQIFVVALILASVYKSVTHKSVTPFLTSLGIVGAAIALASQDTFRNFIGSFILAGDKPFELDERIVVDGHDGIVESIGVRSTRIRTLDGHLVTIPNGELANKTIQNIGKRPYIRRLSTISITYDTTPDNIEKAISIIEKILENHEGMNEEFPPRVFFKDLADYYFDITMIYWYFPPNYWDYVAFTQKVNREIVQQFNAAGIQFAFPTQTIQLQDTHSNT